jgi:hypothetical protein
MNLWVAVALAAVIGVVGCANETSSPLAPEDSVPPALVTGLEAFVHVGTNPNVSRIGSLAPSSISPATASSRRISHCLRLDQA